MFEIVYECSVTSGHPRKFFSQQPKYPVFCCGREMVKARVQEEPGTIDGAGQGMVKPAASVPHFASNKSRQPGRRIGKRQFPRVSRKKHLEEFIGARNLSNKPDGHHCPS